MGNNNFKNSTKKKYEKYFLFLLIQFFNFICAIHSLHFSIDNRLFVAPSDCYQRVSIGSRLPDSLIISTFESDAISDCEAACSANGTLCGSFGFGVGARGNSTCMLGRRIQSDQDNLIEDWTYDIYVKGHISLLGCLTRSDKLSEISPSLLKNLTEIDVNNSMPILIMNHNLEQNFANNSLLSFLKNSALLKNKNQSFLPSINDQIRIYDIARNQQDYHRHSEDDDDDKPDEFNFFPSLYYTFGDYDGNVHDIKPLVKNDDKKNKIYYDKKNIDVNNNNYYNDLVQKGLGKNNEEFFTTDALDFSQFGRRLNSRPTFVFDTNNENSWIHTNTENPFLLENFENSEELEIEVINSVKGEKGKKVMIIIAKLNNKE